MSETVIKLENIGKQYRLGLVGSGTLRDDLRGMWYRMRGKEDPTLKIGEENRLNITHGEYVWALRNINLEVKQGEILGIIGKNGAGKSTLLKLLSRVTTPTTGEIKVKGRIASLLEVGTGFHGELTGRENIFLNGAILGMTKQEIRRKFDEIVSFAGVERYIDTPVKRYSSGMYVRLAFAVAAHLEPEILIVDEVLAVGDAEFQKKAIGKMQDISSGGGRTVLFVSHNMASVQKLCTRGILLENGGISFEGKINEVIENYAQNYKIEKGIAARNNIEITRNSKAIITKLEFLNNNNEIAVEFERNEDIRIRIYLKVNEIIEGINVGIELWSGRGTAILGSKLFDSSPEKLKKEIFKIDEYIYELDIPGNIFIEGDYYITASIVIPLREVIDIFPYEVGFHIKDFSSPVFVTGEQRQGIIMPLIEWVKV